MQTMSGLSNLLRRWGKPAQKRTVRSAARVRLRLEALNPLAVPASLFSPTDQPQIISSDYNAVELGVRFESSVDGVITGIRYYKGPQDTGTHIGNLRTTTGTLLATAV